MYGKVSIIMPNYNCESFVKETIDSVLNQTYTDWELIIVDDCSTDKSIEIIRGYCEQDERIKLYVNDANSGAAASRNRALREATGKWIAFIDSDDLWRPEKLEKQLAFMSENDYKFSFTAYEQIDEASKPIGRLISGPKKVTKRKMFRYCYMGCLTVMYDNTNIDTIQIPDEIANGLNDYAMWLRVAKTYTAYLLNESLALYRVRGNSLSHKKKKSTLVWNHYRLFRISEGRSAMGAWFCMTRNLFYGFWKKILYAKKI